MDLRKEIESAATQAAREGTTSLITHADRAADGSAVLTVKVKLTRDGGSYCIETEYQAQHTDKDGDKLPARMVDPRQSVMEGVGA